jgi:hypothetical protein
MGSKMIAQVLVEFSAPVGAPAGVGRRNANQSTTG